MDLDHLQLPKTAGIPDVFVVENRQLPRSRNDLIELAAIGDSIRCRGQRKGNKTDEILSEITGLPDPQVATHAAVSAARPKFRPTSKR